MLILSFKRQSLLIEAATAAVTVNKNKNQQPGLCPFKLISYSDNQCTQFTTSQMIQIDIDDEEDNDNDNGNDNGNSNSCIYIEDGLYHISCYNPNNDNNSQQKLLLEPCFQSWSSDSSNSNTYNNPFITTQFRDIEQCYTMPKGGGLQGQGSSLSSSSSSSSSSQNAPIKSYQFQGSCTFTTTTPSSSCQDILPDTSSPTPIPTSSPTYEPPAASIILPTPPLPKNTFADQMLDLKVAYECVHIAGKLIYQIANKEEAVEILPSMYDVWSFYDTGSTEVMVLSTNHTTSDSSSGGGGGGEIGKIMVVFRGTDETLDGDWLTNINVPKVPYGPRGQTIKAEVKAPNYLGLEQTYDLKVHRGFNNVFSGGLYEKVLKDIETLLQRTMMGGEGNDLYYNNTIHFYGHSMGGANAQIFGTYYAFFHSHIKTYVTTLGAPRQGNYAYKILVESLQNLSVWRMVNCRDVVPRVPQFQFYHAGHLLWKRCDPPEKDKNDSTKDETSITNDESLLDEKNEVVEAYYRQSGDEGQELIATPSTFIVRQYEPTIISDHFGDAYLEWLGYASGIRNGANWTTYFQSTWNVTTA